MPTFSAESRRQLATCDQRLQFILQDVIQFVDFKVLEGHRNKEAQEAAFARGATKKHWPEGLHNSLPSRAVDIAPYPVDWKDTHRFAFLMGMVSYAAKSRGIKVRFGMDWNQNGTILDEKFVDMPHVELAE